MFANEPSVPTHAEPVATPWLAQVLAHILTHIGEPLPLARLAAISGLSLCRFATVFRQQVGLSPHRYICEQRVRQAQQLLRHGMTAATVASTVGFYDQSHLSRRFKRACHMTPGQYQSEHLPRPPAHRLV